MLYRKIVACRICGNKKLHTVLNLGYLALSGVFPKKNEEVEYGPIELVKCMTDSSGKHCGLLQLRHNYDLKALYGDNYGYRSGLNISMVMHLKQLAKKVEQRVELKANDVVLDIGSNDGTLLNNFRNKRLKLVGVDPTITKFIQYYPKRVLTIPDFFSSKAFLQKVRKKAKVICSIAMLYDLERPITFAKDVVNTLQEDGVWIFEQSYMPLMLQNTGYDTICHEHIEYYAFKQIKWILDSVGLKVIDVETNLTNGGSMCVMAAKKSSPYEESLSQQQRILEFENSMHLDKLFPFSSFAKRVHSHRHSLQKFIQKNRSKGKIIYGYGASTKGNIILQYCNITSDQLPFIAEVNEYKFGKYTPGTNIPIISEKEARMHKPDYFLVLPWHFQESITHREKSFMKQGGTLVFPLPTLHMKAV